ncbi:MAG: endolytic transglycosylase MltG [Candidatus Nanopelagicales bacterium]|jgi:UPF0755 protein
MTHMDEFFDDEDQLPASRNATSVARRITAVAVLLAVVALGWGTWSFVSGLGGGTTTSQEFTGEGFGEVQVVVARGDTLTVIGQSLTDAGVVSSVKSFVDAAEANEAAVSIGPGTYTLRQQMSGESAVALMLDPISRADSRLVLPEGLRLAQTVEVASEASGLPLSEFEQILENPGMLPLPAWAEQRPEGFMFPATYDLVGDETAEQILSTLVARFDQSALSLDLVNRAEAIGRTPYEVLIVASLVQAEVLPEDMRKAAAVIYNRLDDGMPLQFDSTVAYALGIVELQLSADQLATDSPYNTYQIEGLPPTPINSPGDAAIEAALDPAPAKWLYFVTVNPDTRETKFARDYDRFLKLKDELRDWLAENG